ncbi:hypothetical protein [Nioella nitratireducens]|uniref:hypothetical protein n=1 Tax=Nioella nitratireducens TaxID=1287720 RepID=UPI0008FCE97D|nr:hypothetical protein [Nioella nitratireducens]
MKTTIKTLLAAAIAATALVQTASADIVILRQSDLIDTPLHKVTPRIEPHPMPILFPLPRPIPLPDPCLSCPPFTMDHGLFEMPRVIEPQVLAPTLRR